MKIIYYFLDINTVMYQWQKFHIVDELANHNCAVEIFNPLNYETIEAANDHLLLQMQNRPYDLFMTCLNEEYLLKDTLLEIKKIGVPTLLFCPDNLVAPFRHKHIAGLFDLVWLTSQETEYLFKKWNCKTIFLPYAANPKFLQPIERKKEILNVGFIGTPHGSRIDRINILLSAGIPVTIHTNTDNLENIFFHASMSDYLKKFSAYMRYPIGRKLAEAAILDKIGHRKLADPHHCLTRKDPVPLSGLSEANGEYALVLSFTDANSTGVLKKPVNIVNLRNFEIPMSGGLQFTTYSQELARYFEDGKEIVLCKDKEEYVEKALFYLRPDQASQREKIRTAARNRAVKEHTWIRRFEKIFKELGI